jgi:hypothetical protein
LISSHRYPQVATFGVEQAYRYLLDAPSIVKQIAPMAWQYLAAPGDGQLWLEWLPLEKTEHPYPSDGYAWGDMEQVMRHDYGGYQIEMRVHHLGYRPGHDQMSQRARTRYHFVAKNPSVNAPPPDPSLWLVHYHQADHSRWMPANQFPVTPHLQQTIAQRRWLESLGRIERREFMLHDREHWPQVHLPGGSQMQQQGQYNNTLAAMQMNQNRYPQSHYPQQAGNPREAKKPRLDGPASRAMPGSSDGAPDTSIETEEDTALGDFFDHLTQRDISMVRYSQHHQWMEQVFSSPYASHQIVPADLGLGLMGELKGLTDGILDPPDMEFGAGEKPAKSKEVQPFTNVRKEKVEEFSKRVEKHLEEGRAEIERMKAEHAAKMQDWKKVKALTQAEKRLRNATWEGHEDAVPAYRLEAPATNGQTDDVAAGKEKVEDVVKEVESLLKVQIASHEEASRIARGGLQERRQPEPQPEPQSQDTTMHGMGHVTQQQQQQPQAYGATPNGGGAAEPTTYHEDPMASTQTAMPSQQRPAQSQQALAQSQQQPAPPAGDTIGDMPDLDMSDDALMQDMVMGDFADTTNLGDNNAPAAQSETQAPGAQSMAPATAPATTADTSSTAPPVSAAQQPAQQNQPTATQGANAAETGMAVGGEAGDNMFTDTFGDLANLEDGDGLIDFEGGMDDAFGDALHGMDG